MIAKVPETEFILKDINRDFIGVALKYIKYFSIYLIDYQ